MLRDRLLARLAESGGAPDYQRIAVDVLGIRGAPAALARALVEQALVVEDWREHWRAVGARAARGAPAAPGVYVMRDERGRALYVGQSGNLRRRLSAHFGARRWYSLPPALARVETVTWERVGSEIEALMREAALIRDLGPVVNSQIGGPVLATRAIPPALVGDIVLLVPSIEEDAAELIAARADGATLTRRALRSGERLPAHARALWAFFRPASSPASRTPARTRRVAAAAAAPGEGLAPLVFSWLAGRGRRTTRVELRDVASRADLASRLARLLADRDLFGERLLSI